MLNDIRVKSAPVKDKAYKLTDERGMHLLINPNGSKYWRLRYRFGGKEKTFALGVYPQVSLKEARIKREEAKLKIEKGIDPSHERQLERIGINLLNNDTLESIAREWHENYKVSIEEDTARTIMDRLEANIFPTLGKRPIKQITAAELLAVIRLIENRGAVEVAKRVLTICGQIWRYAAVLNKVENNICLNLKGNLKKRKSKNFKRVKTSEFPQLVRDIENYDGHLFTKLALQFTMLTLSRTGEVRFCPRLEEFDLDKEIWTVPTERMKVERDEEHIEHIVPLPKQAIDIILEMQKYNHNSPWLFPGANNARQPMSENTMLFALYRIGYHSKQTVHGFRSLGSTILNEKEFNPDHIEVQLAHLDKDKIRAAYNNAMYLEPRRKMMQWWADYLDELKEGE